MAAKPSRLKTEPTKTDPASFALSSGSLWQRWEPHVHGPGTVLNDQFKGSDAFNKYLEKLEQGTPVMKAIGVTDYYCTEVYEAVLEAKNNGRLPNCDLIFPNIEMRLDVGTLKGGWVNVHLLISPDDPNHLSELRRFLAKLSFDGHGESFCCNRDDLIKLGQKVDKSVDDVHKALEIGSKQFKVSFKQLRDERRRSDWAKANILIAVAGGSDGTGGVRDAADTTLREEIEKEADVIFSSSPNQRDFWLGKKVLNAEQIETRYRSLKPCMHGSDAHKHEDVGAPTGNRFTWIKGQAKFDSLRQACIDPEGRAYIGPHPPLGATPSQVITSIEIHNTEWCETPRINLNPGLVAIIGARGSGKTALAEIIATACDAVSEIDEGKDKSFLNRAETELQGASVSLQWSAEREAVVRPLDEKNINPDRYPMARYLSQQFVDDLCSSDGVTDKLLHEVERVIFNCHDINQREGAINFDSLLMLKATRPRTTREREEKALQVLCDRLGSELDKTKLVDDVKTQIASKDALIARYNADRSQLVSKGSEERVKRLDMLTKAAETVRGYVRHFKAKEQSLLGVQDEVESVRVSKAPEALRNMQSIHASAGFASEEWLSFLTDFKGDVDTIITDGLGAARNSVKSWKGASPAALEPDKELIPSDANLKEYSLAVLEAEVARISALVSADRDTAAKYTALSQRIAQEQALLESLKTKLADYEGAKNRVEQLRKERDASYERVFQALLEEETALADLYAPIMKKLSSADGTLGKMSFSIRRSADMNKWAETGEQLVDLREQGPFKGRGTLKKLAEEMLQTAWESGKATDVVKAMKQFRETTQEHLLAMSKVSKSDREKYRPWTMQLAKWLYSTDHIRINYSLDYDGVDIRKLSPGTRGIVLLLLYLALDDEDDCPLIIDQPEENLDPKSIYDELVHLFIAAKSKRQVIIVTHNANLVVNTDADQIIIAQTGERLPSGMPKISYLSGGLEEAPIRKEVCAILEGGTKAFQKRARRLRVPLS